MVSKIKRNFIFSAISLFVFIFNTNRIFAVENNNSPSPTVIGKIDGESTNKFSIVTVRFNKKPSFNEVNIEDHGSFIQIKLPNTLAPNSGKFYDANSPYLTKVSSFQLSEKDAAVRIFVNKKASKIKKVTDAKILNSRLVITTDHNALNSIISSTVPTTINKNVMSTASSQATSVVKKHSMQESLVTISLYLGVLIALLALTLFLKPILRKKKLKLQGIEEVVEMKQMATLALAPRHKLSLVQVGDEQVLLSVSNDGINLISKIENKNTKQNSITQQLQNIMREQQKITANKNTPQQIASTEIRENPRTLDPIRKESRAPQKKTNAKTLETNDKKTKKTPTKKKTSINVSVSDSGIKDHSNDSIDSIDDVTKMIREKLKNLPSF